MKYIEFINNTLLNKYICKIQKIWRNYQRIYLLKIEWTKNPIFNNSMIVKHKTAIQLKLSNTLEKKFGNNIINMKNNNQWTTKLSENLFKQFMNKRGIKIWKPKKIHNFIPDWEDKNFIYEIKCRNWTTLGTAGEKVLGVPFKYSDISSNPRLYKKPLRIICIAFQEYELLNSNHNIFGYNLSPEKIIMINMWKKMNIKFIRFSKL